MKTFFTFIYLLLLTFSLTAQEREIKLKGVYPNEIVQTGFILSEDSEVEITGEVGNFDIWGSTLSFYAWIINSETREPVWNLLESDEFSNRKGMYNFSENLFLPQGSYEIYLTGNNTKSENLDFGDLVASFFKKNRKFKRSYRNKIFVSVNAEERLLIKKSARVLADEFAKDAFVKIYRVGDNERIEKTFSLKKTIPVRIYSLGEGRGNEAFDFMWIYNIKNHKRVWSVNPTDCSLAGGANKNILVDKIIELEKGSYKVVYQTDDSHSYDKFNALPPNDPQFWGVLLFPQNKDDRKFIDDKVTDDEELKPFLSITKVGDNEYIEKTFRLEKTEKVRIYSLGEAGYSGRMADFAVIVDNNSNEIVWEMNLHKTSHAGGADKNREFDGTIILPKGDYTLIYQSDDSHSYRNWNASQPYNAEMWGVSLWLINPEDSVFVKTDVKFSNNENVLAEITKVRDNIRKYKDFTLERDSKIKIYAIGEGDEGDMFDYGWIENEYGEFVWEMTYRKTKHAGGARKNRLFNGSIMLEKGKYRVYFVTDDSHSFKDWNDTPPRNERKYGITVYKEN